MECWNRHSAADLDANDAIGSALVDEMRALAVTAGMIFASALNAAGEPDWCEYDRNYPMERRGIGCVEACVHWRATSGIEVSEPDCGPKRYASYTFEDAEHQGEKLVCIVASRCVKSGGR